jgi:hypothetical protein
VRQATYLIKSHKGCKQRRAFQARLEAAACECSPDTIGRESFVSGAGEGDSAGGSRPGVAAFFKLGDIIHRIFAPQYKVQVKPLLLCISMD